MVAKSLYKAFQDIVGKDHVLTEPEDIVTYSYDAAVLDPVIPAAVLMPRTSKELGKIILLCSENNLPVTVRGAGTNLSGGTIPLADGVVILTGHLNKIIEINEPDMYAVVQPGVVTAELAFLVEEKGLFYPPDPGSQAVSTLGGNVMENAGGLRGLKYGVTKGYVMGLSFYDAMGNHVRAGSRTVKCGMCQSVCPLFEQTRKEADVARGKLVLLESLMNEMFDNPQGVSKRLNKCLLCGSCAANCSSGVNVVEIFIKARSIITGYLQLSFIKKIVFRKMLAQPAVFDWIINMSSKFQFFFLTDPDPDTQTTSIKLLSPLLKDRRIMPVAESSFQTSLKTGPAGKLIGGKSPTGPKVAFFTGCLIDKIFVQAGIATIKSLIHHNFKVFIPEKQGCCGIPALAAGDSDTFFKLVKHNIKSGLVLTSVTLGWGHT